MSNIVIRLSVLLLALLLPSVALAQAVITGIVRDTSGAVLPGVTVEAASPALIEKVRSVVADAAGQYRIVDLRPGIYVVTFTLPGFSTVKREGIELTGTFVATVNAEMRVGALEETITVTGAAPVVDVQSSKVQQTITPEIVALIPTSRTVVGIQAVLPGLSTNTDAGGAGTSHGNSTGVIHGGRSGDSRLLQDGLLTTYNNGSGSGGLNANSTGAQEIVLTTSGGTAEVETSGVVLNIIPREGGNTFSGSVFLAGANGAMQGSNYSQALKNQGLRSPQKIRKVYDINPMYGGRIIQDKLWFYTSLRIWGATNTVPDIFWNRNAGDPNAWTVDFDRSRPALGGVQDGYGAGRVTWQATPRNKFAAYWSEQWNCLASCLSPNGTNVVAGGAFFGVSQATPEAIGSQTYHPSHIQQAIWTSPVTSRLLLEAGYGAFLALYHQAGEPRTDSPGLNNPELIMVVEQGGAIPGLAYRAPIRFDDGYIGTRSWRASLSYVTGAHAMKVGYFGGFFNPTFDMYGLRDDGIVQYRFRDGVPNQITLVANKRLHLVRNLVPTSFYGQDQWTRGRLTLQGGLRYDYFLTSFPEQVFGGTSAVPVPIVFPSRSTPGLSFHDLNPRMGAAYDLFGNGKTAVKVNLGRYVNSILAQLVGPSPGTELDLNPINRLIGGGSWPIQDATSRSWNDANRNYIPDCDLSNRAANGECGAMANQKFGLNQFALNFDPAITQGWHKRPYNWDMAITMQHELLPRVAVNGGYFRRWFGNFSVVDNLAVAPSDFTPFSVPVPVDARLPGGGGGVIGDLFDITPAKFGQLDQFRTGTEKFGKQIEYWHGVDVGVTARMFGDALTVQSGTSTGRNVTDTCAVTPDNPSRLYCRVVTPFQTSFRGLAAYTIPVVDVLVSGSWRSDPGPQLAANYTVPNAVVRPSLGRDLAGGAANVRVNLVKPGTLYGDTLNLLDFRVAKVIRIGRTRTQFGVDVFNVLNSDTVTSYNQNFVPGGSWLGPIAIPTARYAKISGQFDF